MKTLEQVTIQLQTQGASRAIHEDDIIALITALTAVGSLWHPRGETPYSDAISGASWTLVECWTNALPAAGGRGLLPNLATHRGTIEEGGDGWWAIDWSVYVDTDNDVELGVRLNGSAVGLIAGTGSGLNTLSVQCPAPLALTEGDYLELVARTNAAQTANISIRTAHFWARRQLPTT